MVRKLVLTKGFVVKVKEDGTSLGRWLQWPDTLLKVAFVPWLGAVLLRL